MATSTVKERLALARGHAKRGELAAAEELFVALAREHPGFADLHNELGLLYHDLGDFDRAQASFQRALEINPGYTEAALHLSITWNDLGRYDEARLVFEKTLARSKLGPHRLEPLVSAKIANLYAEIGDAFQSTGESAKAAKAYRDGLELGPSFHDIRMKLAQALLDSGDARGAIRELGRVVSECPELVPAQIALGLAHYAAGDHADAVLVWRGILERHPGHPRAEQYLRLAGGTR